MKILRGARSLLPRRRDHRAAALIVAGSLLSGGPAQAFVPANPDRPFDARTCDEARMRLEEAERGSPLIGPEQNQILLERAIAQAVRLCGHFDRNQPTKQPR